MRATFQMKTSRRKDTTLVFFRVKIFGNIPPEKQTQMLTAMKALFVQYFHARIHFRKATL